MTTLRNTILTLAVWLFLVSPSLWAQTFYVPYAVDVAKAGDQRIASALWVTNRSQADVTLTHYFVGDRILGSSVPREATVIPAGETVFFQATAPPDQVGMLALESPIELQYTAVMGLTEGAGGGSSSSLPIALGSDFDSMKIVSAADATAGGETVVIDGQYGLNDLVIINLAPSRANTCTADVYDVFGGVLGTGLEARVRTLSLRRFVEVTNLVAAGPDARARVDITCTRPFYAYGVSYDESLANVALIQQAPKPDTTLPPPPPPPPTGPCEIAGSHCVQLTGIFHEPQKAKSTWVGKVKVYPPAGNYNTLLLEFTVVNRGWNKKTNGLHNLVWIALNSRNWNMPGYLNVFGPAKSKFLFRHGFNQDAAAKYKVLTDFVMKTDEKYRIRYDYDTKNDIIEVRMTELSTGTVVVNLFHVPNTNRLTINDGDHYLFAFGFDGSLSNEPPSRSADGKGWRYRNLVVEFGNR